MTRQTYLQKNSKYFFIFKFFLAEGSEWLRTKYQGELAVRSEFPDATIFRCADVYGQDDNFINYWFSNWRKTFRTRELSLYGKGEQTIKQPIYRSDLLDGVMASLHDPQVIFQCVLI